MISFFEYPVFYQQQNGFLYFVCPDLNISIGIDLPFKEKGNTHKDLIKISKAIGEMEIRIQRRKKEFRDSKTKLPKPSKVKQILSDEKIKKITAPQLAKLLGKSRDTICRMADRGEIPCYKTKKGTRYFLEKDILPFL